MANLTITVDDNMLKRARIKALENGTSVNAILRAHLETYAEEKREREEAVEGLLELAGRRRRRLVRWTRDELHER